MTESLAKTPIAGAPGRGKGGRVHALAALWGAVLRYRFRVLGLALLCGLGAWLYAASLGPVYRAETTLLIDCRGQGASGPAASSAGLTSWLSERDIPVCLQTQTLLMTSRTLAEAVVGRLGQGDESALVRRAPSGLRSWFESAWRDWLPAGLRESLLPNWLAGQPVASPSPAEARAAVVEVVRDGLRAEAVAGTEVVRLSFSAPNPELAARVANAAADAYLEVGLESRLQAVTKATAWLTGRLEGLRERVEASAARLQAFQEAEGITDADRALDLTARQIEDLADRLVRAQGGRDDLQRLQEQLQRLAAAPVPPAAGPALPIANAAIQALQTAEGQAEREAAELAKRYGPKHPKMLAAQSTLDGLRARLASAIADAVAGVQRDLTAADTEVARIETELAALKDKAQAAGRQEQRLRELKRELETDRQLYETFLTRFKETGQGVDGESGLARVIDPALAPARPIGSPVATIVTGAVLLGLILGTIAALGSDYRNDTIRREVPGGAQTCAGLQESLGLPLLGSIPLLGRRQRRRVPPERMLAERPKSDFAEAIRTVRAGLLLAGLDQSHGVLLVTSSEVGAGNTTLAINLALAFGRSGRTLLIDADLRRPGLGGRFGLAADVPGLCDLMAGGDEAACIHRIGDLPVDVLPVGNLPPDPLDLLSSPRLAEGLARLAQRYGRVVIDAAPASQVSDALILARLCDAVVLVVGAGAARVSAVQAVIARLRQAGTPLLGIVVNRAGR